VLILLAEVPFLESCASVATVCQHRLVWRSEASLGSILNVKFASRWQQSRVSASVWQRHVVCFSLGSSTLHWKLSRCRDSGSPFSSVMSCGFPRFMYAADGILSRRRNDRSPFAGVVSNSNLVLFLSCAEFSVGVEAVVVTTLGCVLPISYLMSSWDWFSLCTESCVCVGTIGVETLASVFGRRVVYSPGAPLRLIGILCRRPDDRRSVGSPAAFRPPSWCSFLLYTQSCLGVGTTGVATLGVRLPDWFRMASRG
jgi:hypothetical protein